MRFLKSLLVPIAIAMGTITVQAQELYVFSEPASNMAAKSIGFRLTNEGVFSPNFSSRLIPELMVGFNKNFMVHGQGYFPIWMANTELKVLVYMPNIGFYRLMRHKVISERQSLPEQVPATGPLILKTSILKEITPEFKPG